MPNNPRWAATCGPSISIRPEVLSDVDPARSRALLGPPTTPVNERVSFMPLASNPSARVSRTLWPAPLAVNDALWLPRFAVPPKSYDSIALLHRPMCLFAPAVGVTYPRGSL